MASQHALGALGWSALQRDAEEEVGSGSGNIWWYMVIHETMVVLILHWVGDHDDHDHDDDDDNLMMII